MDPLNPNVLLWDIQQVFFPGGTQQLAEAATWNFCQLYSVYNTFLAGMNIILEYYLVATTPQFHLNYILLSPMRASMDDLHIISSTVCGAKNLLSCCNIALKWEVLLELTNLGA